MSCLFASGIAFPQHTLRLTKADFVSTTLLAPWRREWQPSPVLLPGESMVDYSPWGHKEWDMTEGLTDIYTLSKGLAPSRCECLLKEWMDGCVGILCERTIKSEGSLQQKAFMGLWSLWRVLRGCSGFLFQGPLGETTLLLSNMSAQGKVQSR